VVGKIFIGKANRSVYHAVGSREGWKRSRPLVGQRGNEPTSVPASPRICTILLIRAVRSFRADAYFH
jgi:hypothetical protein